MSGDEQNEQDAPDKEDGAAPAETDAEAEAGGTVLPPIGRPANPLSRPTDAIQRPGFRNPANSRTKAQRPDRKKKKR